MWKRVPRFNRGKENAIGNPSLIETTYDEKTLQNLPDVSDITVRPAPDRKATDDTVTSLPPLDFGSAASRPAKPKHSRDISDAPSATSTYSRPFADPQDDWSRARPPVASPYYGDVSPPDSPGAYRGVNPQIGNGGDVSPVDLEPQLSSPTQTPSPRTRSHIPVPRKVTPGSQAAGRMRKTSGGEPTRWDKYSGEPTTAPTGQPGQATPGNPLVALKSSNSRLRQSSQPDATTPEQGLNNGKVADKASRLKDPGLVIDTRPPWKGASGRHTIVQPPQDKPGQAIPVPRRSSKRKPSNNPTPSPSSATPSGIRMVHSEAETSPASVRQSTPIMDTGDATRLDPGKNLNRRSIPRKSVETQNSSSREQPNSRFSWTTYNTDTTYQQSPPPSPPPPLPDLPKSAVAANTESIMNRSRPLPSRNNSGSPAPSPTIGTSRKPIPSTGHEGSRRTSTVSSVAPSTASKALPRTPQETSANDLIASLQAQLDDLFLQRSNVQKVIRDFLSTQPQNPLVADLRARREADKKLESLKDDLAEITRLEHDIGLRLHRAYKKRERVDGSAPTALWIRRVTE